MCNGNLSNSSGCFIRIGVSSNLNNSFINAYAKTISNKNQYTHSSIISNILDNFTYEEFKKLNKGSLEILFKNKDFRITPFQNFLEYLISDEQKEYQILGDLFSKPNKWNTKISEEYIIIVIEVHYNVETNKYCNKILCPKYQSIKNLGKKENDDIFEKSYFVRTIIL